MLNQSFEGVSIYSLDTDESCTGGTTFSLTLSKSASIGSVKRFIYRKLMTGFDYTGVGHKQLAVAIFMAFAHPSLTFTQVSDQAPLWYELAVRQRQAEFSERAVKHG